MNIKKIEWSEERDPNDECCYTHVKAETPLGEIFITWKGWKEDWLISYDLEIESFGIFIPEGKLEWAKEAAQKWFEKKVLECIVTEE